MSTSELAKSYDPAAVEAETYRVWLEEKCFLADPAKAGEPYSIVIPPPNVTGALHLGHAINNTLQDILTRVHRMRGFNTVWIPGIDHAGIATQAVVEKQLKEKENKTRHDVGRECLVKRIWAWKQQYGDRILAQLQRLGCSCDWSRTRFTLDEMCARAVRETFFKLFRDGLVYRGKRLVNWDTHLQTSISDDEIYHETVKTSMWHIRYPIVSTEELTTDGTDNTDKKEKSELSSSVLSVQSVVHSSRASYMTVATTRPETLLGDTAVAVHSQDPRWNWAIGMFVELPLTGRKIPIIADDVLVDMAFGSGVVKVTPGHDPNDYAVYQRHLGKADEIAIINLMNPDGTLNENAGKYAGLTMSAARKKVVEDLGELLMKEEPYETQVGHSDRSKTAIQPYLSDQWFVKMAPLAEPALEVVRDGTIKFFPERHGQQYLSWLGEKRDWPISRQLWWGHRIPVWRAPALGGPAAQFVIFEEKLKSWSEEGRIAWSGRQRFKDGVVESNEEYDAGFVCIRNGEDKEIVEELERWNFVQDPDVLDTWFSSALWPHSTLGWPEGTADLAKWYPTSVLMTGRDIITLWVARMVMMGIYNMGPALKEEEGKRSTLNTQRSTLKEGNDDEHRTSNIQHRTSNKEKVGIPFHHVAINPTILDGKGERMSKSKGNGVDPVDVIDTHGADALRFTMTNMATETQDARMPVQVVCPHCGERFDNPEGKAQVVGCPKCRKKLTRPFENAKGSEEAPLCKMTSKRFDEGRNFCTKLWNASKFVLSNLEAQTREPSGSAAGVAGVGGSADVRGLVWGDEKVGPEAGPAAGPAAAQAAGPAAGPEAGPAAGPAAEPLGSLGLADRWILSRFGRAVEESNGALASYRFDQYAKVCYDFFWRDFCDWYVEASKPAMKDAGRAGSTAGVLVTVLDGVLRLMHPMIPFITERIWWQLNEVRPAGRSKRLIHAAWPTVGGIDLGVEETFGRLQEIIVAIRNVRNEYKIDPKKPVVVSLAAGGEFGAVIDGNRELIENLGVCTIAKIGEGLAVPANAARALAAGIDVYVEGVIDPGAEKARVGKQIEVLRKEIAALRGRLANPSYADKAPAHLVQQTRNELTAKEAELAKLMGGS